MNTIPLILQDSRPATIDGRPVVIDWEAFPEKVTATFSWLAVYSTEHYTPDPPVWTREFTTTTVELTKRPRDWYIGEPPKRLMYTYGGSFIFDISLWPANFDGAYFGWKGLYFYYTTVPDGRLKTGSFRFTRAYDIAQSQGFTPLGKYRLVDWETFHETLGSETGTGDSDTRRSHALVITEYTAP